MKKTDMIAVVAAEAEITKKAAAKAVDAVFGAIAAEVSAGNKVTVTGFGTFSWARMIFDASSTSLYLDIIPTPKESTADVFLIISLSFVIGSIYILAQSFSKPSIISTLLVMTSLY